MNFKELFFDIYNASTESVLENTIKSYPEMALPDNWQPVGDNENTFGVIENQQAFPVSSLVEKITNSIDAILTKKCLESGINPKSQKAPSSMSEAVQTFFPDHKDWDLPKFRKQRSKDIQIIADGPRRDTSIIIYDNGEGQHPEDFPSTFLSLLQGNKNEIKFVQGKYNMGGSGAIVFCGKKRYHLIASRKFDLSGDFGFTLIRKHPMTDEEAERKKSTWYEYLVIDSNIPSFPIDKLDLGLYDRVFESGTIMKLYSYQLPPGVNTVISRDLNQSINEYLFEPALPLITIDKKKRYPHDKNLERDLYGLKRRLEEDGNKYIEDFFIETASTQDLGSFSVTCYVFKTRIADKSAKETRQTIKREFFKNNMSVMFSMNGQVHGFFGTEFISRKLKMQLIKDHLIIHVDCTNLRYEIRNELFMASRDRLKQGDETTLLRNAIAQVLLKGKLKEIYKRKRDSISFESENKNELIKQFTRNLKFQKEIVNLLNQSFQLEQTGGKKKQQRKSKPKVEKEPFHPQRYPSFLRFGKNGSDETKVVKVPLKGDRTIKLYSDVEDQYFVRVDDPGELKIGLLDIKQNDTTGGNKPGIPKEIDKVLNVIKGSPSSGTIRVTMNPTKEMKVGDALKLKVSLSAPGQEFDQIFWVKISDPENKQKSKKKDENVESNIGLPDLRLVYQKKKENQTDVIDWDTFDEQTGQTMDFDVVMHPLVEGEALEAIYVNMDSKVLKNYKSKLNSIDQYDITEKRFYSSVYFHTLFLYTITINKKYEFSRLNHEGIRRDSDIVEYLKDLFTSYYAQFLVSFGIEELISSLD